MPNWCECELEISCSDPKIIEEIKEFVADKEQVFSFDKIIPYPDHFRFLDILNPVFVIEKKEREITPEMAKKIEEIKAMGLDPTKDGYNQGGYEWCIENWGTKWDACEPELVYEDETHLYYQFETAWSPPIPVIIQLSKKFPEAWFQLRFFEKGMGFCGIINFKNGEIIEGQNLLQYFGIKGG